MLTSCHTMSHHVMSYRLSARPDEHQQQSWSEKVDCGVVSVNLKEYQPTPRAELVSVEGKRRAEKHQQPSWSRWEEEKKSGLPSAPDVVTTSSANPALPVPASAERALGEGTARPLAALIQVTWLCGSREFAQRHVAREQRVTCPSY